MTYEPPRTDDAWEAAIEEVSADGLWSAAAINMRTLARELEREVAQHAAQIEAMKRAGTNTNAAFCEWAPPEVRAPYFAAWDDALANEPIRHAASDPKKL